MILVLYEEGPRIGTLLGGSMTSNKLHLFNLARLWSHNGMMVSAISMMKRTNKSVVKPTQIRAAIWLAFDASVGYGNNFISLI